MSEEFNLSEKIILDIEGMSGIPTEDVKEFIRRLKEEGYNKTFAGSNFEEIIDKLVGEKLK